MSPPLISGRRLSSLWRQSTGANRRLHALVSATIVIGLVITGWSVGAALVDVGTGGTPPSWAVVVALLLLIGAGNYVAVWVRIRSTLLGVNWTDAAVLLTLAIVPVHWAVLATMLGVAVAKTVQRTSPVKAAFAVTKQSITAFAGGAVLLALGGAGGALQAPFSLVQLSLAFLAMVVLDLLLATPVIALSSRTPVVDRLRTNLDVNLVTAAVRLAVAVGAVLALQQQPMLLYILPVLVLVAHLWHQRWVRTREERQAWQDLAAATESFTGVDMDTVMRSAVTGGARLFSAEVLEVEVWLGAIRRLVRGGAEGISYDGDPDSAPRDDTGVYAVALHDQSGRQDIGAVRLRFRGHVKISEREQAMLSSFAAALDTAVRTAAAYRQLGEATAAHAHAAAHDPLTGLANRRELERRLSEALASRGDPSTRVAVLLIDLKHFKEVNDALGHLLGDRVLTQVAQRLAGAAERDDLVVRFGGDEFAVVLHRAHTAAHAMPRAERFMAALEQPVVVEGLPLVVEANGGLALAPDRHEDQPVDSSTQPDSGGSDQEGRVSPPAGGDPADEAMGELMRRADVAMYHAKRTGKRLLLYSPIADPADRSRLSLAGELPKAVSQREFVLHFQPIVDLATGKVHGAEALARWRHPTRGQLEPRWFLDLLERSNQLSEFTAAVIDDALAAADFWRAAGHPLMVSVNISPRSLLDATLPRVVYDALRAHRTDPRMLCLELTETLAISQLEVVDQVITRLHDIGVRLALDDFGTGYSSLSVLSRIPIHQLKIDRSFVHALRDPHLAVDPGTYADTVAQAKAVVRSTVQLARALDLTVVAEGIENLSQRRLLWEMGATAGQGHIFTKAVPPEQLLAQLTRGVGGVPGTLAEPLYDDADVVRLPRPRDAASPRASSGPHGSAE
jgi:diguanylate cyclase